MTEKSLEAEKRSLHIVLPENKNLSWPFLKSGIK